MARAKAVASSARKESSSAAVADATPSSSTTTGSTAKQNAPDATVVVVSSNTTRSGEAPLAAAPRVEPPSSSSAAKAASSLPLRGGVRAELNPSRVNDRDRRPFNKHTPINLFTPIAIPRQRPVSRAERAQVRYLRDFKSRIHNGPLYAVVTENARLGSKGAAIYDPFEDVDRYTKRFRQEPKSLANFDTLPYCIDFFPHELQSVVSSRRPGRIRQKARRVLDTAQDTGPLERPTVDPAEDEEVQDPDNAEMSESNGDDDFEDDDSEMAGDYNAEGYFDAGEEDGDILDGEGGEDGGGFD